MADKEATERRVYVLPTEQIARIRAYQEKSGISSEVEAVRRLLDAALQLRDTLVDVLNKLRSKYADEKDLRILARDVLVGHALVKSVRFEDAAVEFVFAGDERGRIEANGKTYIGGDSADRYDEYPAPKRFPAKSPSWDAPKRGDLDDEIPF